MKQDFSHKQRTYQENWRKTNISTSDKGFQNGKAYEHIVPKKYWHETFWPNIRKELLIYLKKNNIQAHSGTHNLLSSWVVCANLYFPIKHNTELRELMLQFLKQYVSNEIISFDDLELEFSFPKGDGLHPEILLGETGGSRGSGQTSPDVVFLVKTKEGNGIVLIECKYTEHSFYRCSARRTNERGNKPGNPDPGKCMTPANTTDFRNIPCHQHIWKRKYWDNLEITSYGKTILNKCPASMSGYQLFRQQSLAEGIAKSGKYDLIVSSVAFDSRNNTLINCLKSTGLSNFIDDWRKLFDGKAIFKTWTHQEWVQYVRNNQNNGEFDEWLKYLEERYGY